METTPNGRCYIIDDDADLRRVIAHSVGRAGMAIVECSGLGETLTALEDGRPDLVFLDAGLADATASEVLEVLAEHQCDCYVQVVSGRSSEDLERIGDDGDELGLRMLPPLTKPFRSGAIREVLAQVSGEREAVR